MNKLSKIIQEMPYEDLLKLKKDVQVGNLDKLISKRIEDISPTVKGFCPVCSAEIKKNENLTLIFGPADFRQKASFDGPDCLIYFLDQIRKKQNDEKTSNNSRNIN